MSYTYLFLHRWESECEDQIICFQTFASSSVRCLSLLNKSTAAMFWDLSLKSSCFEQLRSGQKSRLQDLQDSETSCNRSLCSSSHSFHSFQPSSFGVPTLITALCAALASASKPTNPDTAGSLFEFSNSTELQNQSESAQNEITKPDPSTQE